MKHLLVGYDGSALAGKAARLAGWLAARVGAAVTVLHVEQRAGALDALRGSTPMAADAVARAGGELVRAGASRGNVRVDIRAAAGDPSEVLAAAAPRADLVLVGHHGRSGLAALVAGSVAKQLVAAIDPPVL